MSDHMVNVVVQVPLVNGKPQLNLPDGVEVVRENGVAHVSWGDGRALSLRFLGNPGTGPVFCGQITAKAARVLDHLGANVRTLEWIWANAPNVRTWLMDRGVTEDADGNPLSPHVIA